VIKAEPSTKIEKDWIPKIALWLGAVAELGGVPQPNTVELGERFPGAFDRWIVQLVESLRSPRRA
jgi:hypothetical protein